MMFDPQNILESELRIPNKKYYEEFWAGIAITRKIDKEKFLEIVNWCKKNNIANNWTLTHVFFKTPSDAAFFKLTWTV